MSKTPPTENGYYLLKFAESSGLHMVVVMDGALGKKQILCDASFKERKPLYFYEIPDAWWSEQITITN